MLARLNLRESTPLPRSSIVADTHGLSMTSWSPQLLSILRIITGFLFMEHGMQKWLGLPVRPPQPVTLASLGVQRAYWSLSEGR